jgi:hypothetical protein
MSESLPLLTPNASRGARTIARCHDRLATRRRRIEARTRPSNPRTIVAERLFISGLCVVYLISMAANVLSAISPP